jgi:hypothetical protein
MSTQVGSRLAYNKAKEAIQRAGFSAGQAVLSQSFLRLEISLSITKTLYQFPILVNDNTNGAQKNTETRLNLQDAFICSSLGLFFAAPAAATDSNFPLFSYPDPRTFTTANAASSLYQFYNSSMNITINNRQVVPAFDCLRFLQVPNQQSATNAYYATTGPTFLNEFNEGTGFVPIEPGWTFVGSKNNVLQIQLPNAMAAVQAATDSRVVLIMRGHLAQNVTPVR